MNPCGLTTAVSVLASTIAAQLTDDQLTLVAAVVSQLGDTLETIAVQRTLCKNRSDQINRQCLDRK